MNNLIIQKNSAPAAWLNMNLAKIDNILSIVILYYTRLNIFRTDPESIYLSPSDRSEQQTSRRYQNWLTTVKQRWLVNDKIYEISEFVWLVAFSPFANECKLPIDQFTRDETRVFEQDTSTKFFNRLPNSDD